MADIDSANTYCQYTVYGPDPQDCGDPAIIVRDGTPLCDKHWAFYRWAVAQNPDADE